MSKSETKREYPRLENGVVLYGPQDEPRAASMSTSEPAGNGAINLNTATADELTSINGVGKATARDIVAHRKKAGPFESLADCAERVGGVSLEQLEAADVTV